MPKGKAASSSDSNSPLRPPTSLEAQENLMISLAVQCAEKQLRDGTASSQVITHYLKLGSSAEVDSVGDSASDLDDKISKQKSKK